MSSAISPEQPAKGPRQTAAARKSAAQRASASTSTRRQQAGGQRAAACWVRSFPTAPLLPYTAKHLSSSMFLRARHSSSTCPAARSEEHTSELQSQFHL